jgi:ribosomal protein S18 acetylase RimI-like enzyme
LFRAGPEFVIEPFRSTDVVGALKLAQASLGEEIPYSFFLQLSTLRPEFCKVARQPSTRQLLGIIVGTREPALGGRVLLFAVDPVAQGQGVGRALLRSLSTEMALENVRQVALEVRADNRRAIDFYQRHGFAVTGLQAAAYKDGADAYVMTKPLR